ncbi:LysR family transcriptional regulator [Phyllobacterium myrsinacearum]|uniref:DNA-binding transcriptional LysR family regulator n=1 Tax=Phyllobacterium myrsinacearum TaxID=28101 RepID=A0A839EMN4_9HYPH|nr:LysR family transcriptional regulator [Phyllobacterium myrsinacearum]MBA8881843.1 DNA-binding transcriptional LysR family regulator [Phyllobacterium myrsinacearum]
MIKYAKSFCVLAEELHFNKAAARLHLTQPALSYQIKKLEEQLGCILLKRSPHKVLLTEAGMILARELSAALNHVNGAFQMAQDAARGDSGALVIGYCELPEAGNMTAAIRRYTDLYPGVDVTLINMPTIEQVDALTAGSLDVAFLHPPLNAPQLVMRPAGEELIVAALRADHALAAQPALQLAELKHERLIVCAEQLGPIMYNSILAACGKAGFQPKLREEMFRWHSMLDQAASGLGVAFVPASLSGTHPLLVFKPVEDLGVKLLTAIATVGDPTRPAVIRFIETARSCQARC